MSASLTVVTVSYYSSKWLLEFLGSVSAGTSAEPEIIIIDNAEDDTELAPAVATIPHAKLVNPGMNLGYGKAMNLGVARSAPSDWVLLANPDLALDPGAIDELIRVGESDPTIGVVGPLIYTPSHEVYPSARRLPSLRHGIGHALFSRLWPGNPWTRAYLADRENPPRQRNAGWLSGACLLVRRTAFEQVDGFDDKFFMYFEDVDLCARIARADWRIVYAPSAVITHVGGHSTDSINRQMVKVHHQSAYKYLSARYSAWWLWPLRVALRVGLWLRGFVAKS